MINVLPTTKPPDGDYGNGAVESRRTTSHRTTTTSASSRPSSTSSSLRQHDRPRRRGSVTRYSIETAEALQHKEQYDHKKKYHHHDKREEDNEYSEPRQRPSVLVVPTSPRPLTPCRSRGKEDADTMRMWLNTAEDIEILVAQRTPHMTTTTRVMNRCMFVVRRVHQGDFAPEKVHPKLLRQEKARDRPAPTRTTTNVLVGRIIDLVDCTTSLLVSMAPTLSTMWCTRTCWCDSNTFPI
jgi:hypothetical protein